MLKGKKIILAVSASIAVYKGVYLLRLLKKAGAEVKVVATPDVSRFVGELSFSSLSGHRVFSGLWNENWSEHVSLGTWADLMLVAPATANTIAKLAHGLCDNALTAVYLAARCPVMVAPAMDADMYVHPRVEANLGILRGDGVHVLPTGIGFLASGLEGPGRLLEPELIFEAVQQLFSPVTQPLKGKKLMITAGPTREAIDPVRFISNHSTGKMGYAIAGQAAKLGAEVILISGPTRLDTPERVHRVPVIAADEMFQAVMAVAAEQDILIMSAAVSDYTPVEVAKEKMKKGEEDLTLPLRRTQDILKQLGMQKQSHQLLVGFALETQNELENAKGKLTRKNLDFIVLNSLKDKGAGFGHDTNKVRLIDRLGNVDNFPLKNKAEVASDILNKIVSMMDPETSA